MISFNIVLCGDMFYACFKPYDDPILLTKRRHDHHKKTLSDKKGRSLQEKEEKNEWRIFWQLAPTPSNITTNINTCEKKPR